LRLATPKPAGNKPLPDRSDNNVRFEFNNMLDKIDNIPEISLSKRMKDRDDTIETVNHSNRVSTNLEAMKRVILLGDS
jgi:hypothetical protein